MFKKWIYRLITLFLLSTSFSSFAQLVTIEYTATVDQIDDIENVLNGEVTIGQTITGSFIFDSDLPDSDPSPEMGHYEHPDILTPSNNIGISAQIGNLRFDRDYANYSTKYILSVDNNSQPIVLDAISAAMFGSWTIGRLNQLAYVNDISIGFASPYVNVINTDTLDAALANLNKFTDNRFYITGRGVVNNGRYSIGATITSFISDADTTTASCAPPVSDNTLAFKAKVTYIYQSNPAYSSTIALGDIITGDFQFDPATPDTNTSIEFAQYYHDINNPLSGFNINLAGASLSGNQSTTLLDIYIENHAANMGADSYGIMAMNIDLHLVDNSVINEANMSFYDPSGYVLNANTLAAGTPRSINGWPYKDLSLHGTNPDGSNFYVNAIVEEVGYAPATAPLSPLQVLPASGEIIMGQYFDIGMVIEPGYSPVNFIDATVANTTGLKYISCYMGTVTSNGKQTILCRNASNTLVSGTNTLTVKINLVDGSVLNKTVNWDVIGF